jgi:hypothetical protein
MGSDRLCFKYHTWGGYPGRDIYDIQSGIGFVNNMLMFDKPQKAIVRGQF